MTDTVPARDLAPGESPEPHEIEPDRAPRQVRGFGWLRNPKVGPASVYGAFLVSAVLFFWARTPLWLDEAQTVAIARRSIPHGLFQGLREDGSPPLYYLMLHVWMSIVGTGTFAVRSLSGIFAVASVAMIALVVGRIPTLGIRPRTAALLLATSPFVIRYATEARMYSFELFLVLVAIVAFDWLWSRGGIAPTIAAGAVSGALLLTQYWSLYLLVMLGAVALVAAIRGTRKAWRVVIALLIGGAIFSPWLGYFLFQSAHTGAPWGAPPGFDTGLLAVGSWVGTGISAPLLRLSYYALLVVAIAGFARSEGGLTLRRPVRRLPAALFGFAAATMLFGTILSQISGNAYASRYSIVILPIVMLTIAAGVSGVPVSMRNGTLAAICIFGLIAGVQEPFQLRTQAGQVARYLKHASPNNLVVFCPDQLGPAVHRLLPNTGTQVVYPTFGSPNTVDWVDYAKRNKHARTNVFASEALQRAAGQPIWYVYMPGYPTFKSACSDLYTDFVIARGRPDTMVRPKASFEQDQLVEFPAK